MSLLVRRFHVCDADVTEQALLLLQSCSCYRESGHLGHFELFL